MKFTVYGLAQTAGSKRHVGNGRIIDSNPKASGWKDTIAECAAHANGAQRSTFALMDGPLAVEMAFYLPRPKGHYSKSKAGPSPLDSAPVHPATRPDVLKLARCVEDALTGVVWRDDAQIVTETLTKRYGEPARVEVRIVAAEEGS